MKTVAIVAAGGVGKRLGGRIHKSFVRLCGRPMLSWTLAALEKSPAVDGIVVVAHREDLAATKKLIRRYAHKKVLGVVVGGATRGDSVLCGLQNVPSEAQWVLVHDGARPLVTPRIVEETVRAARGCGAATAAIPVVPTIKEGSRGWVVKTLERDRLWAIQTPQVFRRELLEKAHRFSRARGVRGTDDAALVEALGQRVRLAMGSSRNIKVTTPEDLVIAEAFLKKENHAGRNRV